jgi:hypothetical protein
LAKVQRGFSSLIAKEERRGKIQRKKWFLREKFLEGVLKDKAINKKGKKLSYNGSRPSPRKRDFVVQLKK